MFDFDVTEEGNHVVDDTDDTDVSDDDNKDDEDGTFGCTVKFGSNGNGIADCLKGNAGITTVSLLALLTNSGSAVECEDVEN